MLKILPQLFYETPEIRKVLVDGLSCVIHKTLQEPVLGKEGYVSTHAITLVLNGKLRIENDRGFLTEVGKDQLIFIPKGLYTISDILIESGPFEAIVFFFDEQVIREFVDALHLSQSSEKCISHLIMDHTERLKLFTSSLLDLYGGARPPRELTRMKLFEFLHLLVTSQESDCFVTALGTLNNKEKRSLRSFMESNAHKPLSIEDYAYLTGRSLSSFRRDFKSKFGGMSPKKWLIEKRLDRAVELLTTGDRTITTIAFESGYENIPHFIKTFRNKFGITPKQFLLQRRKEVLV